MDGQAGVAYTPWAVVSIERRNYKPSLKVMLMDGSEIRLISLSGVIAGMDELEPISPGGVSYYQMNYTALCALYDVVEE